jgi:hypothetical protein
LGVVEELVELLAGRGECAGLRELVAGRGLDWASVRPELARALRARGYRLRVSEGRVCAEKREGDPAVRLAELLQERGCVRKPEALELLGIGEAEWRRVARRAARVLAARGVAVYKEGYWTYCIQGAGGAAQSHVMSVTIPVRVDPWTNAKLEELAREAGASKAELIRTLIAEHLARAMGVSREELPRKLAAEYLARAARPEQH